MSERLKHFGVALLLATSAMSCDKVPLLAPANSTVALTASARVLPINGSTGLTAFVTESSGSAVQNGTTVRFTTSLGVVQPVETQTINGIAVATFSAGTSSGIADIHAVSAGPTTGTGTGTGTGTSTCVAPSCVQITVGAAAVNTVTLRANPSTVGPNGGSVELIATVVGADGNSLEGIQVAFGTDQGVLVPSSATTDVNGEARTTLTTTQKATVIATAGTKNSNSVVVDVRLAPSVSITCTPATGTLTNCAAVPASASNNTAPVVFTVSKATSSSALREATLDFGDGTSQPLGTLASSVVVTHTYSGPSGLTPVSYVATVRATDVNNETITASTTVNVTPRAQLTVDLVADTSAAVVVGIGKTVTLTATVNGGDALSYSWDFGDGNSASTLTNKTSHVYRSNGLFTATVTVTTTDGRTATNSVSFIIAGI